METLQEGIDEERVSESTQAEDTLGKKESVCQKEQPQPDCTMVSKMRYKSPTVGRQVTSCRHSCKDYSTKVAGVIFFYY